MNTIPKIGLLKSTSKPFERRIPIHPSHFILIDPKIKKHLFVEPDYLGDFGYSDAFCQEQGIQVEDRNRLLASADCCFLVRPMPADLMKMKQKAIALGWMHCVQYQEITEAALFRDLTLVCMEGLFDDEGKYLFQENSKITGQQAIRYALNIADRFDTSQKVAVIGHGSAGVAAIQELLRIGFKDITCFSKRAKSEIKNAIDDVEYIQIKYGKPNSGTAVHTIGGQPIINLLQHFQIIVNATTQNIYQPAIFVHTSDITKLKKGTLIIDISCDRRMGFEFSQATSLNAPIIEHDFMSYCAIDHLPTLDFDNATKAISESLIRVILHLFEYLTNGTVSPLIERAIQIRNGEILNPDISYYRKHFLSSSSAKNFEAV